MVSAASLLPVMADRPRALQQLWDLVEPGGHLLIVETTAQMRLSEIGPQLKGTDAWGLVLWASVRRGRTVAPLLDACRRCPIAPAR